MDLYRFQRVFWLAFISTFVTQFTVGLIIMNQFFDFIHPFTGYGSVLVLFSWLGFILSLILFKKPHFIYLAIASLVSLFVTTFIFLLILGWDYIIVSKPFDFLGPLRIVWFFSMILSIVHAGLLEIIYSFKKPSYPKPEEL